MYNGSDTASGHWPLEATMAFEAIFNWRRKLQYDDLVHINAMVAQGVVVLPNRGAFEECLAASHWDGFGPGFRVRPQ